MNKDLLTYGVGDLLLKFISFLLINIQEETQINSKPAINLRFSLSFKLLTNTNYFF